jgi:DNA-binding GntR family transcriptional regulator
MSTAPRLARPEGKLRERAYDAFKQHLLARDIKPGQFVTQRELVELTGLPLGAIRELIPRLEAEGLIVTIPQRGMQVAQADVNVIRDAFQFRLFLEREAVALFTKEASDAAIKQAETSHRAILARAEKSVSPKLIEEAQQVDRVFHETVIDYLGNHIISQAYRINWLKVRLVRQSETSLYDTLVVPVMHEHLAIIGAMKTRDSEKAVAAAAAHITNARSRALRL